MPSATAPPTALPVSTPPTTPRPPLCRASHNYEIIRSGVRFRGERSPSLPEVNSRVKKVQQIVLPGAMLQSKTGRDSPGPTFALWHDDPWLSWKNGVCYGIEYVSVRRRDSCVSSDVGLHGS